VKSVVALTLPSPAGRERVVNGRHRQDRMLTLETLAPVVVLENGFAAAATTDHVMDRTGIFKEEFSGHGTNYAQEQVNGQDTCTKTASA
jgi:hypothetical protein